MEDVLQIYLSLGRTLCRQGLFTLHNYLLLIFTSQFILKQSKLKRQYVSYVQLFLPLGGCTLYTVGSYRLVCFASFKFLTLEFVKKLD